MLENVDFHKSLIYSKQTFTFSKSSIKTLEKDKYVQS